MRRALSWLATLLISLAALVGLIAIFNSRDKSGLDATKQAAAADAPGVPYKPSSILSAADRSAVRLGNVVVLYHGPKPPPGLKALVPAGGKALEQAGQAVLVQLQPRLRVPLAAVAATRMQEANTPSELKPFIDYWLGG